MEPGAEDQEYQRHIVRLSLLPGLKRCAICTNRLGAEAVLIEEAEAPPSSSEAWLLCKPCDTAVQQELQRAGLRSAQRVQIAVGVVASEHSYSASRLSAEDREEKWIERVLIGIFLLAFAVHALAFVVVVVDLILTH